jgi:hypothetical protein
MLLYRLPVALLIIVALLAAMPEAQGQYFRFGKNKIQYRDLDWHFLQSTHFDVFYAEPGGEPIAAFTARAAEEAYAEIEALLDYRLADRVAILVYQSHNEFAVTNAIDLPAFAEGIGGATEIFKNRIAIPFTGDYREFRRVLHHEIVHAVVNDMLYGGSLQRIIRSGARLRLPLWFNEGIAEFSALGWDSHSDMYVREAVVNDRLAPVDRLYGYFAYRGGQAFFDYVAAQYGREKITEVVGLIRAGASVDGAFQRAVGMDLDELSDRWLQALRTIYYPELAAREDLVEIARPIVTGDNGGRYNTGAALSPRGDRVAFLTARGPLFDVFVAETSGDTQPRRLIAGQTSPEFESFRILTPSLSWNPAGTRLAVAVKSGPSDAIALVDVATRRSQHYRVPGVDAILSVRWSPDGRRIAFSGTRAARTDIYVLDLMTEEVLNLTADAFSDLEPAWAPDGASLVFHSDRGDHVVLGHQGADFDMSAHDYGQFSLYRVSLADPDVAERLTSDPDWDDTSAAFGGDPDRLLFVSDRNGIYNLYELNLLTGRQRPLTDLLTGVTQVSLSADGRAAALVALHDGIPSIFLMREPFERAPESPLAPTVWARRVLGDRSDAPPPALAVAHPTNVAANPFLREATGGVPYAWDTMRRRRLPDPTPSAAVDTASADSASAGSGLGAGGVAVASRDTTATHDGRIDFERYEFGEAFDSAGPEHLRRQRADRAGRFEPEGHLRDDGSFRPRRYRLRFSPDLIYGDLGYDAIFGIQSFTQMSFSDLLGDHRISAASNLVIDLRNSDYLLSYQYLPRRTNYAVTGFHVARRLTDFERQTFFRYRNYGIIAAAGYPLDKFRRIEAELSAQGVTLTDLIDPTLPTNERIFLLPAVTFTSDVSVPGFLNPAGGRRFAVRLSGSPGISVAFASLLADVRQYFGGRFYSVALRASAGASVGRDAQRFYSAGVQNWINPNVVGIPIRDENDFVFGTPVLPLRGHDFDAASGDRFAMVNAEARFPVFAALLPGPLPILPLYNLQGIGFLDAAAIADHTFDMWRTDEDGDRVLEDVYIGAGLGLRTLVLGYPLRMDWAWPFDGRAFGERRFYLSVGFDF